MKPCYAWLAAFLLLAGCASAQGQKGAAGPRDEGGPVVPEGATVEKLAGDFGFTEGPAADADGNVFFTDQNNDQILEWSTDGKLSVFMKGNAGRSNGMCFDQKGRLIACADEKFAMWAIDTKTRQAEVLFDSYDDKKLNGPNDVWIRPDGGMYFTDPYYQRPWWTRTAPEQDKMCVYFRPAAGGPLIRVIDDYQQPNGIIGTPDGKTLYVADIRANQTFAYDIQPDGKLTNKRLFCASGSDGMTIDNRGNVYLTRGGVTIYSPAGERIAQIRAPESPANVCFGGKDKHTLFMTARTGFYAIRLNTYGVGSQ